MKRTTQALVLAALFYGTQALAGTFPGDGEPVVLPSLSTYADMRSDAITQAAMSFPANGDVIELAAKETYAERNAAAIAMAPSFPSAGDGEPVVLPSLSTYADQNATERSVHARGAGDAALSR